MNWALWYPVRQNVNNSWADGVSLLAEQCDTKSNTNLGRFNPSFKRLTCLATLKSYDTMKQSVCGWRYIFIYIYIFTHTHTHIYIYIYIYHAEYADPHGVMVKALDSRIVISKFELQSHNYVHFRTNTLGKGMNMLWVK